METRASYIAVGSFVLALFVGLLGFVVWIGKFQGQVETVRYDILFDGSVTGLQVDGTVRYRGIAVGRILNIRIDPENIEKIRVTVEVKADTPVRADTVASIELQGITGGTYILLSGGMQATKSLPKTTTPPYPVIASKPSALEELFEGAPALIARANVLVDRVTLLFSDENERAISETLQNLRTLTGGMAGEHGAKIADLLSKSSAAVDQIRTMGAEYQQLAHELRGNFDKLGNQADTTMADLQHTATEFRTTAESFTTLANQLNKTVAENRGPIHDFSTSGLYELSQLLSEMRTLVASMTRISTQIERDPARFFFGDRRQGFEAQ